MAVPHAHPVLCIPVDRVQPEIVQEPYVVMIGGIETIMYFQLKKKILPFHTKIMHDVVPESLNLGVVNAPEPYSAKRVQTDGIDLPAEDV